MYWVTITNQKGGAAKSTNIFHLAGAFNARGEDVLLVDMDYQGGLTNALGHGDLYSDVDADLTPFTALLDIDRMDSAADLIQEHDEFDLFPSSEQYMVDRNLSAITEEPRSQQRLRMLAHEHTDIADSYDRILVDTGPRINALTNNALVAARNYLVPIIPEKLNQSSLRLFLKHIRSLERAWGEFRPIATLPSRVEDNMEHKDNIETIKSTFSMPTVEIPKWTDLSQSLDRGVTVFEFEKENDRVRRAREVFTELAELVDERAGEPEVFFNG